jgi:SAM-dependent methyltransferase
MIAEHLETDVEELKNRIRAEVGRRRSASNPGILSPQVDVAVDEEPLYSEALQFHLPLRQQHTIDKLTTLVERARGKTEVNRWIPRVFRRLFRKQGAFNKLVLESFRVLLKSLRELRSENAQMRAYLEAQYYWLRDFAGHRQADRELLHTLRVALSRQREMAGHARADLDRQREAIRENNRLVQFLLRQTDALRSAYATFAKEKQSWDEGISRLSALLAQAEDNQEQLRQDIATVRNDLTTIASQTDALGAALGQRGTVTAELERIAGRQADAVTATDKLRAEIESNAVIAAEISKKLEEFPRSTEVSAKVERVQNQLSRQIDDLRATVTANEQRQRRESSPPNSKMSRQKRTRGVSERETMNASNEESATATFSSPILDHRFDSFYLSFENRFRGERSEIKSRQEIYLPYLAKLPWRTTDVSVLDLGCGRGEWLELLQQAGYPKIRGVDVNAAMVSACRELGLQVVLGDGIDYLSRVKAGSLALVTAFQVIEHLRFDRLMRLLTEAHRALKHGGLFIVETPNPDNLIVGAKNFYTDPTHRNPLPSVLTSFLAEYAGFGEIEILNQHPFSHDTLLREPPEMAARFNEMFYSEQDYAVIGTKP